jgi:hypothetical protein
MRIRMTGIATTLAALAAAAAVALGGASPDSSGEPSSARTALVIDAGAARDGRELVDARLRETDAEVRLPRTAREARTNVRYFAELGYRVVVAGPSSQAAAEATGVEALRAAGLPEALRRL